MNLKSSRVSSQFEDSCLFGFAINRKLRPCLAEDCTCQSQHVLYLHCSLKGKSRGQNLIQGDFFTGPPKKSVEDGKIPTKKRRYVMLWTFNTSFHFFLVRTIFNGVQWKSHPVNVFQYISVIVTSILMLQALWNNWNLCSFVEFLDQLISHFFAPPRPAHPCLVGHCT